MTLPFDRYRGDGVAPEGRPRVSRAREPGSYLAAPELVIAVNTALAVGQPLLVTGEPGTGKTALAWSVASELGLGDPLEFHTRSDHQAKDVFYFYDSLARFYDAQTNVARAHQPEHYVAFRALGLAIRENAPRVVLIDEIDKAPRDFPNDLLDAIDRMAFEVHETGQRFEARDDARPIVIITSNSERQLPDAFLRRCVFHHIEAHTTAQLERILAERIAHPALDEKLAGVAIKRFEELRALEALEKPPATSELLVWVKVLLAAGVDEQRLATPLAGLPHLQALIKTRHDLELVTRG